MTGKQKTAAEQKQSRLEAALRANLSKRKAQAKARDGFCQTNGPAQLSENPSQPQKQPDESVRKR